MDHGSGWRRSGTKLLVSTSALFITSELNWVYCLWVPQSPFRVNGSERESDIVNESVLGNSNPMMYPKTEERFSFSFSFVWMRHTSHFTTNEKDSRFKYNKNSVDFFFAFTYGQCNGPLLLSLWWTHLVFPSPMYYSTSLILFVVHWGRN